MRKVFSEKCYTFAHLSQKHIAIISNSETIGVRYLNEKLLHQFRIELKTFIFSLYLKSI